MPNNINNKIMNIIIIKNYFKCLTIFSLLPFSSAFSTSFKLNRRSLLAAPALLIPKTLSADDTYHNSIIYKSDKIDPYSHWSFFGLAPPPIEKVLSYDELLNEIQNENIVSIQIAIQHNCVIATTIKGHRLSCLIPDSKFQQLLDDSKDKDGDLPFVVLPIDKIRLQVRDLAQVFLYTFLIINGAAEFNLIDYDNTPYNSIKEKEEYYESGEPPRKLLKTLIYGLEKFLNNSKIDPDS